MIATQAGGRAFAIAVLAAILLGLAAPSGRCEAAPAATSAEHYFLRSRLLIDPRSGATIERGVIEVSGGRILRVGRIEEIDIPSGAKVLDYRNKFVIPGLIDVHGHLYTSLQYGHTSNDVVPRLYLPAGVTSVLSPGSGNPAGDLALKQLIDSGRLAGPRLFLTGEYIEMAPAQAPWMETVATEAEARAKIDFWVGRGASAIKVYAGMNGDILRATIAHAHALGVKVHGHLGATSWTDAIEMGIDAIHHGIYAFPEIEPEGMPPLAMGAAMFAPPELGFDKYYEAIATFDLTRPEIRRLLDTAAKAKVVLFPTAVALVPYDLERDRMHEQQPFYAPDAWKKVEQRALAKKNPFAARLLEKNLELIRRAGEAGCLLATGTDLTTLQMLPGFSLWREMELFAQAGLPPMKVLEAATINGAIALGAEGMLGSLEPGKLADLVVLDANPLEAIGNVRSVYRVVKGGVVYDPQELLAPLKGKVH